MILCIITKIRRHCGLSCTAWSGGGYLYGIKFKPVTKTNDQRKIIEENLHIFRPKPLFLEVFLHKRGFCTYPVCI